MQRRWRQLEQPDVDDVCTSRRIDPEKWIGGGIGEAGVEKKTTTSASGGPVPEESDFITGFPLACLVAGLMVAQFLVSIDRTIISTVSRDALMTMLCSIVLTGGHSGNPIHHARI
jgi:hypothetical protein